MNRLIATGCERVGPAAHRGHVSFRLLRTRNTGTITSRRLAWRLASTATLAAGLGVLAVSGNALGAELVSTAPPSTAPVADSAVASGDQPGEPMDIGLAPLTLTAPDVAGAGDRPAFAWEAVDGAASYQLAVLTTEGVPLWAWTGPETTVILGGWPEAPIPEAPGPLIQGPGTWFVVAFDSAGVPIANSVIRPVSPT